MRVFRRVMLGSGIDIESLPDTQKLYYKATAKVTPKSNSLGAPLLFNKWDSTTGEGVIVCAKDISKIGVNAFMSNTSLTSITIPDSVTVIGESAFQNCSSLTSVTISNSVTSIGSYAFSRCDSLINITIPDSVTSIGGGAFEYCTSLPIVDNIRYADTYLVEAVDKSLTSYSIKAGTRFIGPSAFRKCSNAIEFTIPPSVSAISGFAFSFTTIETLELPEGVIFTGNGVFDSCYNLIHITLPSSVTIIPSYTFRFCSNLSTVVFLGDVSSIAFNSFQATPKLSVVKFEGSTSVPTLNAREFFDSRDTVNIVVPDLLYDEWVVATNWAEYADRIIKKSDWDASQTTE